MLVEPLWAYAPTIPARVTDQVPVHTLPSHRLGSVGGSG